MAGARRVIEHHEHLNAINVFPVPDGDTGNNMAGTMRSIAAASAVSDGAGVDSATSVMAQSALEGARGNSGAILAQFMCGFSEKVQGLTRMYPKDFVDAAEHAALRAREAISSPREGTIVSVIQEWAAYLRANCHKYQDFQFLFCDSLKQAQRSLAATKEKLAVLRKANVVDAGGQGFVYLLEGVWDFTEKGSISTAASSTPKVFERTGGMRAPSFTGLKSESGAELPYLFCTECLLKGDNMSLEALRTGLGDWGDCVIVAGTTRLARIHVHTNNPDDVFALAGLYGTISGSKVENMSEQHSQVQHSQMQHSQMQPQPVGLVTDSTCDLPATWLEELGIVVAPLRLFLDGEELVDKVDITAEAFNRRLSTSTVARTSQPAPGDIRAAYSAQLASHDEVLALHVMGLYSGTVQSARTVGRDFEDRVHALDSRTLTAGLGLVVLEAARRARAGMSGAEILTLARKDTDNVRVFVAMDTLDFAVRGGRISRGMGFVARQLHIRPVLEFATRHDGRVNVAAKGFGTWHCEKRLLDLVEREVARMTNPRFAITHVDAQDTAERLAEALKRRYGVGPLYVMPASAVLGVHSGPGACAISLLGDTDEAGC